MVEYKQLLLSVALTNPLALIMSGIVYAEAGVLDQGHLIVWATIGDQGLDPGAPMGVPGALRLILSIIFFLVTTELIHWWKYREKYKKLTKAKALLAITDRGGLNLLLCAASLMIVLVAVISVSLLRGGRRPANPGQPDLKKDELISAGLLSLIAVAFSGVSSELLLPPGTSTPFSPW